MSSVSSDLNETKFAAKTLTAHIGNLKDRRVSVLVYTRNDLAILHASQMLYGPGNAGAKIQLGRDILPRLPDL